MCDRGDTGHAQREHLLTGVDVIAVLQRLLLGGGVRGEERCERHQEAAHAEPSEEPLKSLLKDFTS